MNVGIGKEKSRAVSFLGIHKSDFRYSVVTQASHVFNFKIRYVKLLDSNKVYLFYNKIARFVNLFLRYNLY